MKDELGGKIVAKFVRLRAKTYTYLIWYKRHKKKCFIKRKIKLENFKNCLEATQLNS